MKIIDTIGYEGCACGDYESDTIIMQASCRKSGRSPDCSEGIAHLLEYKFKSDTITDELSKKIDGMFGYGGDCVVVVRNDELKSIALYEMSQHDNNCPKSGDIMEECNCK